MRGRRVFLFSMILSIAGACSGSDGEADAGSCPSGTSRRATSNEVAGDGAETREDAVRAELEDLGLESSDQAISAGVIAGAPGSAPRTEEVQIGLTGGPPVTMTLTPLDPGWAVTASTWCAPAPG